MKSLTGRLVAAAVAILLIAPALTVAGSAANLDVLLSVGIICWFAGIALLFASLVAWVWARSSRRGGGGRR